jgi:hypothetical protein
MAYVARDRLLWHVDIHRSGVGGANNRSSEGSHTSLQASFTPLTIPTLGGVRPALREGRGP